MSFRASVTPPPGAGGPALWFVFRGDRLLVETVGGATAPARMEDPGGRGLRASAVHFVGTLGGTPCWAAEVAEDAPAPDGTSFSSLRPLLGVLDDPLFSVAGTAFQVVDWDRTSRFCGRCAAPTAPVPGERARRCPECGLAFYPRIAPAVIVAVVRGDRVLLARSRRFAAGFWSVLAGFVEPGETFEECVAREVREETGIGVRNIRYFGSQPWPFPHSLMVGFTAEYAGGEIALQEEEIVEAGWFPADALPQGPRTGTIARRLIDWFARRSPGGESS